MTLARRGRPRPGRNGGVFRLLPGMLAAPVGWEVAMAGDTPVQTRAPSERTFFGHPRALATLFLTEMWERFSFYGMRAILVLYLTAAVADDGLAIRESTANAIYGT